ncbi:hypothetical protein LGK95_19095 [Clostridium algoriphilum]|uniref:hypothetical protein n=1 Tax=Clostridium algoriphilum TaxID=198347 RepID=UPI001CF1052A|nr:hypothetical protein [Clostridium algoriphilum]MCB2295589.1 hypothetical protein [Clostridium algoriphilum]
MENIQKPKVGAGILTVSIIQLVLMGFTIIGLIASFFIKDQIKAMGIPETPTSIVVISLIITIIVILGIVLILMKKELGIYMYFVAEVANIMYAIVSTGFKPTILISLILPALMAFFIWKKKEIFAVETKVKM